MLNPSLLPGAIWVTVVRIDAVVETELPMWNSFAPSVHGRTIHRKLFYKVAPYPFGCESALVWDLRKSAEPCVSFVLDTEYSPAVLTDRGIRFPVTKHGSIQRFCWPKDKRRNEVNGLVLPGRSSVSSLAGLLVRMAKILVQPEKASLSFVDECNNWLHERFLCHPSTHLGTY